MSVSTVYDSLELECPREYAAEVLELCFYYMNDWPVEQFDWLLLPVGVDAEISGLSWGQTKHIARGSTQEEIEALLASELA